LQEQGTGILFGWCRDGREAGVPDETTVRALVADPCSPGHVTLVNVISVTWKLICVYYAFFHAEFKYVIRIALPLTVFV